MKKFSRRSALFSAGLLSLLGPTCAKAADFELVGLGRQFDAVAAKLDRAIEHGLNIDWSDLKEFGRIVDEIVAMPATTIDGLCVSHIDARGYELGATGARDLTSGRERGRPHKSTFYPLWCDQLNAGPERKKTRKVENRLRSRNSLVA